MGTSTTDLLHKRVSEQESIVWDIPNLMNLRFTRFDTEFASMRGAIADNTGRLQAVERAMTHMRADMRDLRGGVTRQLVAQDAQLQEMKAGIDELKSDVGQLKSDVNALKSNVASIERSVEEVLRRLPRVR
jgi:chromosome segregation ATPase